MKHILLFFALFLNSLFTFSQNNELSVGLAGIGPFKLGMTITEVEKITGQKVSLTKKTEEYILDTISVNYKGAELKITFYSEYIEQDKYKIAVYAIASSSPLCKTRSGISIGDEKLKIITTYDTYFMEIAPDVEDAGNGEYKNSKTKSTIILHGQNENGVIEFRLLNNKVISFTVMLYEGC